MAHVNLNNAGRPGDDGTYRKLIEEIQKADNCPFCPEHLEKYHKNPIIRDTEYWTLTTNMYPYEHSKYHFLLILKSHKTDTKSLSLEEWTDLHTYLNWLTDEHKIPGGTLVMRFGDTAGTGASVTHLHAHYISPDFNNPDRKPILARVG